MWLKVDHKDTDSIACCCELMQELLRPNDQQINEVKICVENFVIVMILFHQHITSEFIVIIHFRVLYTLAHCIEVARRLFMTEQ